MEWVENSNNCFENNNANGIIIVCKYLTSFLIIKLLYIFPFLTNQIITFINI